MHFQNIASTFTINYVNYIPYQTCLNHHSTERLQCFEDIRHKTRVISLVLKTYFTGHIIIASFTFKKSYLFSLLFSVI